MLERINEQENQEILITANKIIEETSDDLRNNVLTNLLFRYLKSDNRIQCNLLGESIKKLNRLIMNLCVE